MTGRTSVAIIRRLVRVPAASLLVASCGVGPPPPDDLEIAGIRLAKATGVVHADSHIDHGHGLLELQKTSSIVVRE